MRWGTVFLLAGLLACGGKESDDDDDEGVDSSATSEVLDAVAFDEQYASRFCAELAECNPTTPCVEADVSVAGAGDPDCAFEPDAARECVDAAWPCVGGALEVPFVCSTVYACG